MCVGCLGAATAVQLLEVLTAPDPPHPIQVIADGVVQSQVAGDQYRSLCFSQCQIGGIVGGAVKAAGQGKHLLPGHRLHLDAQTIECGEYRLTILVSDALSAYRLRDGIGYLVPNERGGRQLYTTGHVITDQCLG